MGVVAPIDHFQENPMLKASRTWGGCAAVLLVAAASAVAPIAASAQSTVGDLTGAGGMRLSKADLEGMMPMRVQYKWPNGQGEGDLTLSIDGQLAGTEHHYGSRSDSPAVGSWKVGDDDKLCTPKEFKAWGRKTDLCWYTFKSGDAYFMALTTDADAKVFRIKSIAKAQ